MALSRADWKSIFEFIRRIEKPSEFLQAQVIKSDELNRLVYVEGFFEGIPVIGFEYEVSYFDTQVDGTVKQRKVVVKPKVPKAGDLVLIGLQNYSRDLPKCLGIVTSTNYSSDE